MSEQHNLLRDIRNTYDYTSRDDEYYEMEDAFFEDLARLFNLHPDKNENEILSMLREKAWVPFNANRPINSPINTQLNTRHSIDIDKLPNFFGHGTNWFALLQVLEKFWGQLVPGNIQKWNWVLTLTGESLGNTDTNSKYVSSVLLSASTSRFDVLKEYANNASGSFSITPSNINDRIAEQENRLRNEKYSHLDTAQNILLQMRKIKDIFETLSDEDRDKLEKLSKIPVIVIGDIPYVSDFEDDNSAKFSFHLANESASSRLNIRAIAIPREYIELFSQILLENNFNDIIIVPIEEIDNYSKWKINNIFIENVWKSSIWAISHWINSQVIVNQDLDDLIIDKKFFRTLDEIPEVFRLSLESWEIDMTLFIALNRIKYLEDSSLSQLKNITYILKTNTFEKAKILLAKDGLLYNDDYVDYVFRSIKDVKEILSRENVKNDDNVLNELFSLKTSKEFIKDNFTAEKLSMLSLDEYIALLKKVPARFIIHATRHGYRERWSHHNHIWDFETFHHGFENILNFKSIQSIGDQDIWGNYSKENVENNMNRIKAIWENTHKRVYQLLYEPINMNIESEFADANAIHGSIDYVADHYYGAEEWNSIFILYPAALIASQYMVSHQNWGVPKWFYEPTDYRHHDKNDLWMMRKNDKRWVLPLDAWIVFIPKNKRVDPLTGSKYKHDELWNKTSEIFGETEWVSTQEYWEKYFKETNQVPSKVIFYNESDPNLALDSFRQQYGLYNTLWQNIHLDDMFSENMITQLEMRKLLDPEAMQYEYHANNRGN